MSERLAVIVLNYFGHENTLACAASVRRFIEKASIFIVDNSADENEKGKLQSLFDAMPDVHLIFPNHNLGFAAGVNLGLAESLSTGHSRFFLLNNDAVMLEGSGEIIGQAFTCHPGSLMSPTISWAGQICAGNYYHRYWGLIRREKPRTAEGWLFYLTGCALLFDRDFLNRNGFLNESFFMYGEDVEFSARACENGNQILCLPEIIVDHAGSESARMASLFYEYHIARSHYLLSIILSSHPLERASSLAAKSICLLLRASWRCLRYRTLTPLYAFCMAPFKLPIRPS